MLERFGILFNRWAQRWVPEPFVLALGLTLVVGVAGALCYAGPQGSASATFFAVTEGWFAGVTNTGLLAFAFKMALILVTGHALALSPPVQRGVGALARVPRSAAGAAAMVALFSCCCAVIHWGLGAVAGAFLAREIGRHAGAPNQPRLQVHYPLLGAAAYAGFAVWHGGLTGSAPTKEAGEAALLGTPVPLAETIFAPLNLAVTGTLLIVIPLVCWRLVPRSRARFCSPPQSLRAVSHDNDDDDANDASWLYTSRLPGGLIGGAGFVITLSMVITERLPLALDAVVVFFLFVSLAAQGSLRAYVDAITDGARGAGAILLQFPLYFGLLGIMKATGLIAWFSDGMASLASSESFAPLSFLSAGIVNFFVPSGGAQWAVQADILYTAGQQLQVDPATTVMAFAYGDAWTNLLQPFWALPLLGIMGLRARDIIGYTAVIFVVMGAVVLGWLAVLT